jgi:outer membrane autotransporter protein
MLNVFRLNGICAVFIRAVLLSTVLMNSHAIAQTATPVAVIVGAPYRVVADSDQLSGESVILDASGSVPTDASYVWYNSFGEQIATGIRPTVQLSDGLNFITLVVTSSSRSNTPANTPTSATASAQIQVSSPSGLYAHAFGGLDVVRFPDTNGTAGESITLDGSASTPGNGTITSYTWVHEATTTITGTQVVNRTVALGVIATGIAFPDGINRVRLTVTDDQNHTASQVVFLHVGNISGLAAEDSKLVSLPSLTRNQQSMAIALDSLCPRLAQQGGALVGDQVDLLARCNGILNDSNPIRQQAALDELTAQDLNALHSMAQIFARSQNDATNDRMAAVRGGARGISVDQLSLRQNGKAIPNDLLAKSVTALGGGASADEAIFDDRFGLWFRGNYDLGSKEQSSADRGFDANNWGLTVGTDYRFSASTFAGIAVGYEKSELDFNPINQGGLSSSTLNASIYGSLYAFRNFYLDGSFEYGSLSYDSQRHILYTDSAGVVDRIALGSTKGRNLSGSLSAGYDFTIGALSLTPSIGYVYVGSTVNSFAEHGAQGLDLAYDRQGYRSGTGKAGLNLSYAWKLSSAVLVPYLRSEYVREFEKDVSLFTVHFVNDPFTHSGNPTPLVIVAADNPDTSYLRFAAGISAQFKHGISGYVDYQRFQGLQYFSYQSFSLGLRVQRPF